VRLYQQKEPIQYHIMLSYKNMTNLRTAYCSKQVSAISQYVSVQR